MPLSFSSRLAAAVRKKKTPTLVGLDPRLEQLPAGLSAGIDPRDWSRQASAYADFCRGVIDVVAPLVPAVKPQAAFFEQLGPAGMLALAETIDYARERGLIVLLDGKRGDIGSTATGYAEGWLGGPDDSPWAADALTVNPYLGDDSLSPFVDLCKARGAGIFVLVKTSNPGGKTFQDLVSGERTIYQHVAGLVERFAAETADETGYGAVGAVVGATYPHELAALRAAMPHTWILIPGYGSQGGTARDVAVGFDAVGLGALVNNSRGIIFAHARGEYRERFGAARWQEAVEAATRQMIDELRAETTAGKL